MGAAVVVVLQAADFIDEALRSGESAPIQGGVIATWLVWFVISVMLLVMIALAPQTVNRHSRFRPYVLHAAWAVWPFAGRVLLWWRSPLLVTEGWDHHDFFFFSIAPLFGALARLFLIPTGDSRTQR